MGDTINIYTSQYGAFVNANCMFVEYHDILKIPMFSLLFAIQNNKVANGVFDLSEIKTYHTVPEMLEWYVNRTHRNIFECFPLLVPKETLPENFFDDALYNYLDNMDDLYNLPFLSFAETVASLSVHNTIVKNTIIYNERYSPKIEADIKNHFPPTVNFIWGDFREVLPQIEEDTTFVFSDMNKLNIMAEMKKLNYRSVIVAQNYRYNLNDEGNPIADADVLLNRFEFNMAILPAI